MPYHRDFFRIQLSFAQRIAQLSGRPLAEVLIEHTTFRNCLQVRVTETDTSDPIWQDFLRGLAQSADPLTWTYTFYLEREKNRPPNHHLPNAFGCFSYIYPFRQSPTVRLHFENKDSQGPLKENRIAARRTELTQLLTDVRTNHPDASTVRGGSWLYNIEPYCRLFPPAYIATAKPVGHEVGFMALWGQFLHKGDQVDPDRAEQFITCLHQKDSIETCYTCFPFEVLRPECSIEEFYNFYSI